MLKYYNYIKEKGLDLSVINPGSTEKALSVDDALEGVSILKKIHEPVVGGDILTLDANNVLSYVYQSWGSEYHSLSWSCERLEKESDFEYRERSYEEALRSINAAAMIAEKLNKKCFIVLVV